MIKKIEPGQTFGKLTTLRLGEKDQHGRYQWECQCECGETTLVKATYLRTGTTKSCGCLQSAGNRRTHGHKTSKGATQAYTAWVNMKKRCYDPDLKQWHRYGGRGIKVCDRWKDSFENFLLDMGNPPSRKHSLDRKDNDGDYTPKNCHWATKLHQRINSSGPLIWVDINGERLILKEAVRKYSTVGYMTVFFRVKRGWPIEDAILKPKSKSWSTKKVVR